MDVVGGGAGVTAQQLSSILAHPAEFNVVVILLLHPFISPVFFILPFTIREIILGLPLDAFLLLVAELQSEAAAAYMWVGGGGAWSETKREGCGAGTTEYARVCMRARWLHSIYVHICVWSRGGGRGGGGGSEQGNGRGGTR